jgi:hypothetical protein
LEKKIFEFSASEIDNETKTKIIIHDHPSIKISNLWLHHVDDVHICSVEILREKKMKFEKLNDEVRLTMATAK